MKVCDFCRKMCENFHFMYDIKETRCDEKPDIGHKLPLVEAEFTPGKFWALTPAFNLNFAVGEFEFEWLCVGIYIRWKR